MPTLSTNFIIPWDGLIADIPANTSRYTAWDGKYFKVAGTGADALGTGGAATHLHDCSCPAHTFASTHTHNFSAGTPTGSLSNPLGSAAAASTTHTHAALASNTATTTMSANNSFNSGSVANEPPYKEVIFLQSDGTLAGVPDDALAFFNNATPPTSWTLQGGGKMLKGAAAASECGADGGATSHSHTLVHTHAVVQHTHAAKASNLNTGSIKVAGSGLCAADKHSHSVSLNNQTAGNVDNCASFSSSSDNDEPLWRKLAIIKNETGGVDLPDQIILIWIGTHAAIPTDFARLTDEDDYFVKGFEDTGDNIGDTGGSAQHNHTDTDTTHTHGYTHNHTATAGQASGTPVGQGPPGTQNASTQAHTHTWTIGNATQTSDAQTVVINNCASEANYPPYAEGILVKYTAPSGAVPLRTLMGFGL